MPLMNSTGALKQQRSVAVTPIAGEQWLAQFANTAVATIQQVQPMPSGDTFVISDSKLIKLNSSGSKTFANLLSGYQEAYSICADSSNNLYMGGLVDNYPTVIKYDSSGNILWQTRLSTSYLIPIISIQVASNGDVYALLGSQMPISGFVPYTAANSIWRLSSTGTVINQRKTLKASTSFVECLFIDSANSKLYVCGTEYTGSGNPTKLLVGSYGLTNTDVAETLISITRSTNELFVGGSPYQYKTIISDGTYVYQIAAIGGGGSAYTKINKSTGATSYFYSLSDISNIDGITMDNLGYMYIFGSNIVCKVRMSDGVVIWGKRIGSSATIYQMTWSSGYLYIAASKVSGGYSAVCIKLKDDGSVTPGTYGGWAFANVTLTPISPFTPTNATATGNNTTTAYTNSALTYTQSTASVTVTTTALS